MHFKSSESGKQVFNFSVRCLDALEIYDADSLYLIKRSQDAPNIDIDQESTKLESNCHD